MGAIELDDIAVAPGRALERICGNREDLADAAFGLNDAWRTRIDLQPGPQPQHLNVDAAVEKVFMNAGRLKQMLAGQGTLWRLEERQQ